MRGVKGTGGGVAVVECGDGPGQGVRVAVAASGICGSDLHLVSLGPTGVVLGHEFSGHLDDGTPVAVCPVLPCGHCPRCLAGDGQQCADALGSLYGVSLDGGLAEAAFVDERCARPLPAGLAVEHACLVEPLAVALHGLRRAGVDAGSRVLLIGAGAIGLAAVAAARVAHVEVDLLAHRPERLAAGERLGASTSVATGYDVVLDAAGTQSSLDAAIARVRPGGTVCLLGSFWDPVTVGLGFQLKEAALVPAFLYGHHHGQAEFDQATAVLAESPDLPGVMITHRFALDDADQAFRVAADRDGGAIKVVLEP